MNSLILNGIVFMPIYSPSFEGDEAEKESLISLERNAKTIYESLGFRVVEVDSLAAIRGGGAVHCLSCTVSL